MKTTANRPAPRFEKGQEVNYYGYDAKVTRAEWNPFTDSYDYKVSYRPEGSSLPHSAAGLKEHDLKAK